MKRYRVLLSSHGGIGVTKEDDQAVGRVPSHPDGRRKNARRGIGAVSALREGEVRLGVTKPRLGTTARKGETHERVSED